MTAEKLKIAIPNTGRMAQETLEWMAQRGVVDAGWAGDAVKAIGVVRKMDSQAAVIAAVQSYWQAGLSGIAPMYDIRSGWRIGITAAEGKTNGTQAIVYGSPYPTISGIREGLADAAVIGLDDLFAAMVPYLARGKRLTCWGRLNRTIWPQNSTDVRVAGSTGTQDYAGICLLSPINNGDARRKLSGLKEGKIPVYVKGRNQGLAYYLLGSKVDARPTEEIEDTIVAEKCFGFDVVRTGRTAVEKGLYVLPPRMLTFSVVAVDMAKYSANENLKAVIQSMKLVTDPRRDYVEGAKGWQDSVSRTLGKLWVGK